LSRKETALICKLKLDAYPKINLKKKLDDQFAYPKIEYAHE
jgi:hypothetical protein